MTNHLKRKAVDFRQYPPRILSHYEGEEIPGLVVINPSLEAVKGIPPHLWKLNKDGVIVKREGAIPPIFVRAKKAMKRKRNWALIISIVNSLALVALVTFISSR